MNDGQKIEIDMNILFEELGLADLPQEVKDEMSEMLHKTMEMKMKYYLMEQLTDEEVAKLDKMNNPDGVIQYFIDEKGVNFAELVVAVAQESREELLQDVAYIRGRLDGMTGK